MNMMHNLSFTMSNDGGSLGTALLLAFLPYIILFTTIFILGLLVFIKIIKNPRGYYQDNLASLFSFALGLFLLFLLHLDRAGTETPQGFMGNEWFFLQAGLGLIVFAWFLSRKKHETLNITTKKLLKSTPRLAFIIIYTVVIFYLVVIGISLAVQHLTS